MLSDTTIAPDILGALECVLFMADRPLSLGELSDLLEISTPAVRQLFECLDGNYVGIHVIEVAGGYQLVTKPEYADYMRRLHEPPKLRMSPASLETLAIIAYRQPITRPEIEALRGVNSDGVVNTLLEHDLICERGHKEAPGRPMRYGTTDSFLTRFGLASITALPDIATFVEQQARPLDGFSEKEE